MESTWQEIHFWIDYHFPGPEYTEKRKQIIEEIEKKGKWRGVVPPIPILSLKLRQEPQTEEET